MSSTANIFYTNKTAKIENELFEGYSDELLTFASAACIIFIIVGVPGNVLTIIALSRGRQTRNSTALFIINLSLSDLLFGCFNLPLAASTFMERAWNHSDILCKLFPLLRYGLVAVSLFSVSLITINRYIIIAHPRQYPRIYQRRYLGLMIAGTWITAFSVMIPTWRGIWGKFGLDIEIGSCSILHDEYDRSPKEFLFLIAFMVPGICIVFCYARIFYLVRKAAFRTREPAVAAKTTNSSQNEPTLTQVPSQPQICENANAKNNGKLSPPILSNEQVTLKPFVIDDDIEFIDVDGSLDNMPISYNSISNSKSRNDDKTLADTSTVLTNIQPINIQSVPLAKDMSDLNTKEKSTPRPNTNITTSVKTSFTRFNPRKTHYVSMGNTSNASSIYPGKMSQKDRRLLKMILVIFVLFVICYLPITITKIWKSVNDVHIFNISGYLLIYLSTCINPIIYVLMSSEYRQAYWNLLRCRTDQKKKNEFNRNQAKT